MNLKQQGQRRMRGRVPKHVQQEPQLFDDTSTASVPQEYLQQSYSYPNSAGYSVPTPQEQSVQGQEYLNDPMANIAMHYGQTLADQGKDYMNKNLEKYVSTSKLKYYFAVDTSYVMKKLGLLLFPYAHKDWSVRYNEEHPPTPRFEINAPDLYIPVMALVTYILLVGVVLGTQNRFTPEQLGLTTSTALLWLVIEIVALLVSMYILRVTTDLKYLDLLAYCGYKYVGMILALTGRLMLNSQGYYIILLWTSISTAFYLIRTLKLAIVPHSEEDSYSQVHGSKRRLYMLMLIAVTQPIFMWFLTIHLA